MDPSEKRDMVYKVASALKTMERILNNLCVACLIEAKAEAEMLALGLGNADLAKRRLEQARKKIVVCPATAYMTELIDYSLKMLERGEYGKAVELIEHIIDSLFTIRPEELVKCA